MTSDELLLAKKIFIVFSITIAVHLWENVLEGVITGYNRFITANGIRLFRLILRILFTYVGLSVWKSPLLLVWLDLVDVYKRQLLEQSGQSKDASADA